MHTQIEKKGMTMEMPSKFTQSCEKHFPIASHKEALILRSPGKTGKTTTCHRIYELLVNDCGATDLLLPELEWPYNPSTNDEFSAVLVLNGTKIYIASSGDNRWHVEEKATKQALEHDCRLIIGASRTKMGSLDAWWDLCNKGYSLSFYDYGTPEDTTDDSCNIKRAHVVVSHLLNLV